MNARDIINLQEAYLEVYSEPEISEEAQIAAEYFYEQGLTEDGIAILIEELGVDEFNDWVFEIAEEYQLNEAAKRGGTVLKGAALRKSRAAQAERTAEFSKPSTAGRAAKKAYKSASRQARISATQTAKASQAPTPRSEAPAQTKKGIGAAVGGALKWAREKGAKDIAQTRQGLQTLGKTWQNISDTQAAGIARGAMIAGSKAIEKHGHAVGSAAGRAAGRFVRSLRKEEFEEWVDSLIEEGYDLSEYSWDDMYEIYEANVVMSVTSPSGKERSVSRIRSGQETPEQIRNRRFSQTLADREKERKSKMNAGRLTVATKRGIELATNRSERGENDWVNVPLNPPKAKPPKSLKGSERQKAFRDIRQKKVDTELKDPKKVKQFRRRHGLPEEFELILSHLLDEGYAETLESAEAILESMSEEWVSEILDEANRSEREVLSKLSSDMRSKMGPSIVRGLRSQRDRATAAQRRREQNTPSKRKKEEREFDRQYTFGGFTG